MTDKKIVAKDVYAELMRDARPEAPKPPALPPPITTLDPAKSYRVPVTASPMSGDAGAKLTIVVFSDFECKECAHSKQVLDDVKQRYGADVRVVFKNAPLSSHRLGLAAAEAAMAANEQGLFWAYHDALVAFEGVLDDATFDAVARKISGLDVPRWQKRLGSGRPRLDVQVDAHLASQLAVKTVPTFFVNGRPLVGLPTTAALVAVCEEEKVKAEAILAKGVLPSEVYETLQVNAVSGPGAPKPAPDLHAVYKIDVGDHEPSVGPATARVTIVEWADFQSPPSADTSRTLKDLLAKYPDDVRLVFRQFPLPGHPEATLAAEAALAAHAQGKFWEMHDALYDAPSLERAAIEAIAEKLALDMGAFRSDLDAHEHMARIDADLALGGRFGVGGTPTFFINGRTLSGALSLAVFEGRVREEIEHADAVMKVTGVEAAQVYAEIVRDGRASVDAPVAAFADSRTYTIPLGDSPSRGPADAPVTIVVFGEFECEPCGRLAATLYALETRYEGKLRIVAKQVPLPVHDLAPVAAEAALAAHAQGKYWEMHDRMIAGAKVDRAALDGYAAAIGLDMTRFAADLDGHAYKAAVDADLQLARGLDVRAVPTLFVNGKKIEGAAGLSELASVIDHELSASKQPAPDPQPAPPQQ